LVKVFVMRGPQSNPRAIGEVGVDVEIGRV
jgi:hypothetical protein